MSFEGRYYSVKNASLMPPPTRGHIPLYIGGSADKALEWVAQHGDGYFGEEMQCDRYKPKLRALGKDPEMAHVRIPGLFLAVAHDPEQAMEELAPPLSLCEQRVWCMGKRRQGFRLRNRDA